MITKRALTLLLVFSLLTATHAETITFNVETPGTLNNLISGRDLTTLTDLKITGKINGDDIAVFNFSNGIVNNGIYQYLESLDLSEADIVAGGIYSQSSYYDEDGNIAHKNIVAEDNILGEKMFCHMPKLKKLILPTSITKIEEIACWQNDALEEVVIADNVDEIGSQAFDNCDALTTITIGKSVKTIGAYAFAYHGTCNIKTINVLATTPPTFTTNSLCAFNESAYKTATLNVPDGSEELYKQNDIWKLFYTEEEEALTFMTITVGTPGTLQNILKTKNTSALTDLKIIGKINGEDIRVFNRDLKYQLVSLDLTEAQIVAGGVYYSAKYSDGTPIEYVAEDDCIGKSMFSYMSKLRLLKLPVSVTKIEEYAFYRDSVLEEVANADNVKYFGSCAFMGCSALNKIAISKDVIEIEHYAFKDCNLQGSLYFGENTEKIGFCAFSGCTGITDITITSSETSIGGRAFESCTLRSITCLSETPPILEYGNAPNVVTDEYNITGPFNAETFRTAKLIIPEGAEKNYTVQPLFDCGSIKSPRALWRAFFTREIEIPESGFLAFCAPFCVKVPDGVIVYRATGKGAYVELTKIDTQIIPATALNDDDIHVSIGVILYKENGGKVAMDYTEDICPKSTRKEIGLGDNHERLNCWDDARKDVDFSKMTWYNFNPITAQFERGTKSLLDPYVDFYMYNCSGRSAPLQFANGSEPLASEIIGVTEMVEGIPCAYYSVDGKLLSAPQKGVNIVRYVNGKIKKIVVK